MNFLTSKEIIIVYIVAGIACLLCFIIYLIDKTYMMRKRKHNTKELKKLVEDVHEELEKVTNTSTKETLETKCEPTQSASTTSAIAEQPIQNTSVISEDKVEELSPQDMGHVQPIISKSIDEMILENLDNRKQKEIQNEDLKVESSTSQPEIIEVITEPTPTIEELKYTDVEPDPTEAQQELWKLTQELEQAEEREQAIDLTSFEEEQEKDAIISLEELMKKSKEMVANNELTQYADEGNEPICLEDLERKMQQTKNQVSNTISQEPVMIQSSVEKSLEERNTPTQTKMVLDDFNNIKIEEPPKPVYQENKKFQRSPIISPIYGIERKEPSATELELEMTANYDKLDEEIKKTNEFLMTLKELQKYLD